MKSLRVAKANPNDVKPSHLCGRVLTLWLAVVLLTLVSTAGFTDQSVYYEGSEDKDPVQFWVSNGGYQVNFKGLTEEMAFSGKRSFKLDITLKSGSYNYWSVQ